MLIVSFLWIMLNSFDQIISIDFLLLRLIDLIENQVFLKLLVFMIFRISLLFMWARLKRRKCQIELIFIDVAGVIS